MKIAVMQWLWANKEWLFSGLGIALVSVIYRFWFHQPHARLSVRNNSMVGSPVASGSNISQTIHVGDVIRNDTDVFEKSDGYKEQPSPDQIQAYLESLPIYQQADAANAYCGLKVSWPVRLRALFPLSEVDRRVLKTTCTHDAMLGAGYTRIVAYVDVRKYPRLKIMHEGTWLRICGVITFVSESGGHIRLNDTEISFD